MTEAILIELDTRNCWTLAEALGHSGPHRLQHLLSRSGFLPQPRRDLAHLLHWSAWRRHHRYQAAARAHRWNNIIATATT
jgi:hypothetical protein